MSDYHLLGLDNLASVVTNIEVKLWGNEVCISCLLDPLNTHQPFQLIFCDTREIHWNIHDIDELEESNVNLTGFMLGEGKHRKSAVITTTMFEIFISYESLWLKTNFETREIKP